MSASGDGHGSGGSGGEPPTHAACACQPACPPCACHPGHGGGMIVVPGWGACCTCKAKDPHKDHPPKAGLLPRSWHVPPSVYGELSQLDKMATAGGAPTATIGGAQAFLLVLLAALPAPPAKTSWEKFLGSFRSPPPPTATGLKKPAAYLALKQAREDGVITVDMLDAAGKLPLDPGAGVAIDANTPTRFVAFLIELADAIYAQKQRMI